MKKASLAVAICLSVFAGATYAQTDKGITMNTDPDHADQVLRHAHELQNQPQEEQQQPMVKKKKKHQPTPYHKKPAPTLAPDANQ